MRCWEGFLNSAMVLDFRYGVCTGERMPLGKEWWVGFVRGLVQSWAFSGIRLDIVRCAILPAWVLALILEELCGSITSYR